MSTQAIFHTFNDLNTAELCTASGHNFAIFNISVYGGTNGCGLRFEVFRINSDEVVFHWNINVEASTTFVDDSKRILPIGCLLRVTPINTTIGDDKSSIWLSVVDS